MILCKDGHIELAIDRIKNLDLKKISQAALSKATGEFGTLDL